MVWRPVSGLGGGTGHRWRSCANKWLSAGKHQNKMSFRPRLRSLGSITRPGVSQINKSTDSDRCSRGGFVNCGDRVDRCSYCSWIHQCHRGGTQLKNLFNLNVTSFSSCHSHSLHGPLSAPLAPLSPNASTPEGSRCKHYSTSKKCISLGLFSAEDEHTRGVAQQVMCVWVTRVPAHQKDAGTFKPRTTRKLLQTLVWIFKKLTLLQT